MRERERKRDSEVRHTQRAIDRERDRDDACVSQCACACVHVCVRAYQYVCARARAYVCMRVRESVPTEGEKERQREK